jgi:hypothetical protein
LEIDRMNNPARATYILRAMLALLVAVYASALYLEWHPSHLSIEATQYQSIATEVMSGLSLKFGLQKLSFVIGNGLGGLGVALMFFGSWHGFRLLAVCPLLLGAAALFGAYEDAYPSIESTTAFLLWCASSAIWGAVAIYAPLQRALLFSK